MIDGNGYDGQIIRHAGGLSFKPSSSEMPQKPLEISQEKIMKWMPFLLKVQESVEKSK